jgi:hypothetical protein
MDADANGKDPDTYSYQLAKNHQLLWSKSLPNGSDFSLGIIGTSKFYLKTIINSEVFECSSDRIVMTMLKWKRMTNILYEIPKLELDEFDRLANTIGSYIIFPRNQINNQPTINAIRGISSKIKNRFDLTLECIRLYYENQSSPLYEHLKRYQSFFDLFVDFIGYVDFFLLQDLVDKKYKVQFWLPFESFENYIVIPGNIEEYLAYKRNVMNFIENRNKRIMKSI